MNSVRKFKGQSSGLLYEKVANYLRDEILNNRLLPGQGVSSESKLCERFSASRGPVRQAMEQLVKERLILRKPGRGTFVAERTNAYGQDTEMIDIGIFIDDSSEAQWGGFISEMVQGLNSAVNNYWPQCRLYFQFHDKPHEVGADLLTRKEFGGVIFIPIGTECIDFLKKSTLSNEKPIVSFFRQLDASNVSQFYIDHEEGAFQATDYLLRNGHERIGIVVISPIQLRIDSKLRLDGYSRALKQQGMGVDPSLITEAGMTISGIRSALHQMLNEKPAPTALLIGGQALFSPCVKLLDEMKIKIPDDISVISFDDCIESEMHEPPISVVKQPFARGTRLAVERLIAEIQKSTFDTIKVSLKPELIIRDSCCALKKQK